MARKFITPKNASYVTILSGVFKDKRAAVLNTVYRPRRSYNTSETPIAYTLSVEGGSVLVLSAEDVAA